MRAVLWLLAIVALILVGSFPALAGLLAAAVVLTVTGLFALLAQPAILTAVCVTLVAVSFKRRRLA